MKTLKDRVWETRKARIKMEKRLLRYALISDILIPWYSLVMIAVSLVATVGRRDSANIASILGSIFILVLSVIASGQQFRLKAESIKSQYIDLDEIYRRLSAPSGAKNIEALAKQYHSSLSHTPNHSSYDYLAVMMECRNLKDCMVEKPTFVQKARFVLTNVAVFAGVVCLFGVLPLLGYLLLK